MGVPLHPSSRPHLPPPLTTLPGLPSSLASRRQCCSPGVQAMAPGLCPPSGSRAALPILRVPPDILPWTALPPAAQGGSPHPHAGLDGHSEDSHISLFTTNPHLLAQSVVVLFADLGLWALLEWEGHAGLTHLSGGRCGTAGVPGPAPVLSAQEEARPTALRHG